MIVDENSKVGIAKSEDLHISSIGAKQEIRARLIPLKSTREMLLPAYFSIFETGVYAVNLLWTESGKTESCALLENFNITCKDDHVPQAGKCVKLCSEEYVEHDDECEKGRIQEKMVCGIIGALLACLLGLFLWYLRKNRARWRDLISSFLMNETVVAVSFALEIADFLSDTYLLAYVMRHDHEATDSLKAPWIPMYAISCVITAICTHIKFKVYLSLHRKRRFECGLEYAMEDERTHRTENELADARKNLGLVIAGLFIGMFEDPPLGTLGLVYLYRVATTDKQITIIGYLSTALSWLVCVRARVHVCVRTCVGACVRVCTRACVRACMRACVLHWHATCA